MAFAALTIDLDARLASFEENLRRATSAAEAGARKIESGFSLAGKAFAALTAVVSVGALVNFAKDVVVGAAALDDFSEKTGASVEKLSQLQQVARIGGQDFGAVTDTLVKLSRVLAGQGTEDESKGVGAALKRIGLSADELRQKDPADALRAIAVELNKYEDSGGKAALVTSLLGKNAAQLLPYLKDLATTGGINVTVTAEQAAQAEELEKAFKRLSVESYNAKQSFLLDLVPALNDIIAATVAAKNEAGLAAAAFVFFGGVAANAFNRTAAAEAAKRLQDVNTQLETARQQLAAGTLRPGNVGGFFGGLIPDVKLSEQALGSLRGNISQLEQERDRLQKALTPNPFADVQAGVVKGSLGDYKVPERAKPAGGGGTSPVDAAIKQLEQEALRVDNLSRRFEVLRQIQLGHYGEITPAQAQRLEDLAAEVDRTREISAVQKQSADARQRMVEFADRENAALAVLAERWRDAADPLRAYNRHLEEGASLLRKGLIGVQEFNAASNERLTRLLTPQDNDFDVLNRALKEGDISLDKYTESVTRLRGELTKTKDDGSEIFAKINSGLEDAIVNGVKFSDVLKNVAQDIAKVLTRQQITEPLGKAASELFKDSKLFDGVGNFFKGIFSNAPPAANGADFTVGGVGGTDSQLLAMRVTPGEHVSIRTPAQQQTAGGGVTVNFNPVIDARGADIGAVQRIDAALRNLQANVVPMVVDAVRRGGPARQFLKG